MAVDPSLLPALRIELGYAKQVTAGGQPPRPERIAAIEEAIRIHEAAEAEAKAEAAGAKSDAESKPAKARKAAKAEVENTADHRGRDDETETADA